MAQNSRQIQSQAQQQVQTLSPQQVLLVKLLELPTVELEERVHAEILDNPALEEGKDPSEIAEDQANEYPTDPDADPDTNYNEDVSLGDYRTEDDIPVTLRMLLGYTTRERLNTFVHDIIENSLDKDSIQMSPDIQEGLTDLRKLMFRCVYTNPEAKHEEKKAVNMLKQLYNYYTEHPEAMSREYREFLQRGESRAQTVCDYISGMTDQYSMAKFRELYIPQTWEVY